MDAALILAVMAFGAGLIWNFFFTDNEMVAISNTRTATATSEDAGFDQWLIYLLGVVGAIALYVRWIGRKPKKGDKGAVRPARRRGFAWLAERERAVAARDPAVTISSQRVDMDLLQKYIVAPFKPRMGRRLEAVTARPLEHEISDAGEFEAPWFYIGGEMELRFTDGCSVFISWQDGAGFRDAYSIQASDQTLFEAGSLRAFDLSATPPWDGYGGARFTSLEIWGDEEGPAVLRLNFMSATLLIAQGIGGTQDYRFGAGNDVIVVSGAWVNRLDGLERLIVLK